MVLENKAYVPTLAIRASEMNGLEFLPGATKDRMTPCILLAPWVSSSTLELAIDRVERAFPNRDYFLDIDHDYVSTNLESEPQQKLKSLLDPNNAFINWTDFVAEQDNVFPCIQSRGQNEASIRMQIGRFQEIGRPYCMRIERNRFPANIEDIVAAINASGTADFSVILEGGWTNDPLSISAWFEGIMTGALREINVDVPVVLSCTSIPKLFTSFVGVTPVPFSNRQLVDQIEENSNRTKIIYGDWGSTRPREYRGGGSRPVDRIDYPRRGEWYISRNKDEEWDFEKAAEKLIGKSDIWDGTLGIWGEEMISQTAINEEIGIDTPQKNVAARVNIHLHRQAFYDYADLGGMDFDEDWED